MKHLLVLTLVFLVHADNITGQELFFNVTKALDQLSTGSQRILRHIPGFHTYAYDGSDPTRINDGGFDMYDKGNKITIRTNGHSTDIEYERFYKSSTSEFYSKKIYPFTALWGIENGVNSKYSIEVSSNYGSDGAGYIVRYNGTISVGSYVVRYKVFQVYHARSDPSVCEVFFVVENEQEWKSTKPLFLFMESSPNPLQESMNRAILTGSPRNVLFGYALYSKLLGELVTEEEVQNALMETVKVISNSKEMTLYSSTQDMYSRQSLDSQTTTDGYDALHTDVNMASTAEHEIHELSTLSSGETPVEVSQTTQVVTAGQRATPSAAQNTHPESNTDYGTTTVYAPLDHKALLPATEPETASTTAQSRYEESPTATLADTQVMTTSDSRTDSFTATDHVTSSNTMYEAEGSAANTDQAQLANASVFPSTTGAHPSTVMSTIAPSITMNQFQSLVQRLNKSTSLTTSVSQFHFYNYDNPQNISISDGGGDMYDGGNEVTFYVNGQATLITYNRIYRGPTYRFASVAKHPFIAFFLIDTNGSPSHNYTIRVNSNLGADGTGIFSKSFGSVASRGHTIQYRYAQVYQSRDPTVCEVYFVVQSLQSSGDFTFTLQTPVRDRHTMDNRAVLNGTVNKAIFGYMLLSTSSSREITSQEIRSTMSSFLDLVLIQGVSAPTPGYSTLTTRSINQINPLDSALELRQRFNQSRSRLTDPIDGFHFYLYSGSTRSIADGGQDMYDGGNEVYFYADGLERQAVYNESYGSSLTHTFTSLASHPFVAFFRIKNPSRIDRKLYKIRVYSNLGADGSGSQESISGSVSSGNLTLSYRGAQVYDAYDAGVCEVYFSVNFLPMQNPVRRDFTFTFHARSTDRRYFNNEASLNGVVQNAVFGYILLSRTNGSKITNNELQQTMQNVLSIITNEPYAEVEPDVSTTSQDITTATSTTPSLSQSIHNCNGQVIRSPLGGTIRCAWSSWIVPTGRQCTLSCRQGTPTTDTITCSATGWRPSNSVSCEGNGPSKT